MDASSHFASHATMHNSRHAYTKNTINLMVPRIKSGSITQLIMRAYACVRAVSALLRAQQDQGRR